MRVVARRWGWLQGDGAVSKAVRLIARRRGRLQGDDGAFARKAEPYCWPRLGLPGGKTVRCFLVQLSKPKEVNRPYTLFIRNLSQASVLKSFLAFCNFEYSKFLDSFLTFFLNR